MMKIAIYSGFSHEKWWIFPVRYVNVYQRVRENLEENLQENLPETIDFPKKYMAVSCKFFP